MIQTTYDPEADAMSVWFADPGVVAAATEEVAPGVMLDFDCDGQVIGVEVSASASAVAPPSLPFRRGQPRSNAASHPHPRDSRRTVVLALRLPSPA